MSEPALIQPDPDQPQRLRLARQWQLDQATELNHVVASLRGDFSAIDARAVARMDAAGALLLLRLAERFGVPLERIDLSDSHRDLVAVVHSALSASGEVPHLRADPVWRRELARIGTAVVRVGHNLSQLLGFLGLTLVALARTVLRPGRWRITATAYHMEETGLDAMPLVALLSFLIGAVVAFLGATVLRDFGAELFVVDLISYAFLREFGVLLTAILLAGRTASAFTAQIGTMKSREEVDAMRTLGLDPIELLVLPRLLALLVMLPVLSVIATIAGLLGGLLVSVTALGIPAELFASRLEATLELRHYLVGLIKAPLFAMVIAMVGCLEGFKVAGTAQSVGERTTSAVVQSITLVILIDALAAVFFMELGW